MNSGSEKGSKGFGQRAQRPQLFYNNGFDTLSFVDTLLDSAALLDDHGEQIETAARALKAIAHPLRLRILCMLGDSEICVRNIVDAVGTTQSNISQHLAILREKGVLSTRKDANRVFYRISDPRTLQLVSMMREVFCGEQAGGQRR
jgi:ArsR family transcriptional regulator